MKDQSASILIKFFAGIVEFGNRYFTLGSYFFSNSKNVFRKIEVMLLAIVALCVIIWTQIHALPFYFGLVICIFLIQRIFEYLIVYSRNFIFNRGRIFTHFSSSRERGQWLIVMFFLNIFQTILIFAIWFRFISINMSESFSRPLSALDSLYYSMVTFLTIGYGDIVPTMPLTKILSIIQGMIAFYTVVIVINGLISIHFREAE